MHLSCTEDCPHPPARSRLRRDRAYCPPELLPAFSRCFPGFGRLSGVEAAWQQFGNDARIWE